MKIITTHTFKHILRDVHKNTENRKFCFIIGAGASRKSGIPTGGELAKRWFSEIEERFEDDEFDRWIEDQSIDKQDLAASYGKIYRKRFEYDKTTGYEFLVQTMKEAKPSFGHIVLAQVLSRTSGHCVITTNFDSLVESAVYQFTDKTPLVCGHESLSGYARPSKAHPLIIKIHRDLLLSPKSDPDEINILDPGWTQPLDHIFSTHIPIIIGYGGNDGSLMSYFEKMNKPSNFFWCVFNNENVSERIKNLIKVNDGCFVKINGFDELMHELLWVFDEIKPIKDELNLITSERILVATKQLNDINVSFVNEETTRILNSGRVKNELSAYEYINLINKVHDFEKRKQLYLVALDIYPNTGWLWWDFTFFLHFEFKDYEKLDEYYLKALEHNKDESGILTQYALFLQDIKKNYIKAEEYYLRAIAATPDEASTNSNYASFLRKIKKDYSKAEEYYLKALAAEPDEASTNSNYASFLVEIKKEYTKAEEHFLKSLAGGSNEANIKLNYAKFLQNLKKDYIKAEEYFLKAIAAEPDEVYTNGNYASFLSNIKKNYTKAEEYYLIALSFDPDGVETNGYYASFLFLIKKDYTKAEGHFLKALAAKPDDDIVNGNYAYFLSEIKNDYSRAEEYYLKALAANPDDDIANMNFANFLKEYKKDYSRAEEHYLKALAASPDNGNINMNYAIFLKDIKKNNNNAKVYYLKALTAKPDEANINGNYAQFLLELGDKKEALNYFLKAFYNGVEDELLIELWFYCYAHFPENFPEAEKQIEELLEKGIRSIGWNFDGNIKKAIKEKHPNPKKLKEFAIKISTQ